MPLPTPPPAPLPLRTASCHHCPCHGPATAARTLIFADLQAQQHLDWTGRPRVGVQELQGRSSRATGYREQLEPSGRSVGRRLGPGRPPPSYPGAPVVADSATTAGLTRATAITESNPQCQRRWYCVRLFFA
eukprot:SAG31_NODE_1076_length_10037_cov_8.357818_2_plen_132_part_00